MRRPMAVGLLVASSFVLVATPVAVLATRPADDVGMVPGAARGVTDTTGAIAPSGPSGPTETPSPRIAAAAIEVRSARLADYRRPNLGPRPVRITISTIGVRGRVVPVGVVAGTGDVQVPTDVDTVGWYRFGPTPGAEGSAMLLGHVDSRTKGLGVFFRLREVAPGDLVRVDFADGSRAAFQVVARRSYPKSDLPAILFDRAGRTILALVTCGGSFDEASRSYDDNVVVFAVPRS
jgi:Sortase domain